jgi:hypothetical protein
VPRGKEEKLKKEINKKLYRNKMSFSSVFSSLQNFNSFNTETLTKDNFFSIISSYFSHHNIIISKVLYDKLEENKDYIYQRVVEIGNNVSHREIYDMSDYLGLNDIFSSKAGVNLKERAFFYALYILPFLEKHKDCISQLDRDKNMKDFLSAFVNNKKILVKTEDIPIYFNIHLIFRILKGTIITRSRMVMVPLISLFVFGKMYQTGGGACTQAKIINNILIKINPIDAKIEMRILTSQSGPSQPFQLRFSRPSQLGSSQSSQSGPSQLSQTGPSQLSQSGTYPLSQSGTYPLSQSGTYKSNAIRDVEMPTEKEEKERNHRIIIPRIIYTDVSIKKKKPVKAQKKIKNVTKKYVLNNCVINNFINTSLNDADNSVLNNSVLNNSVLNNSVLNNSVLNSPILNNSVLNSFALDNSVLDNFSTIDHLDIGTFSFSFSLDDLDWNDDLIENWLTSP